MRKCTERMREVTEKPSLQDLRCAVELVRNETAEARDHAMLDRRAAAEGEVLAAKGEWSAKWLLRRAAASEAQADSLDRVLAWMREQMKDAGFNNDEA